MGSKLQPVRGTRDMIGVEARLHQAVGDVARRVAGLAGFEEWFTPIFEDTRVFSRGLGETSDVVAKEMYVFEDRGGESLTLRPENTAGVCRALVTNGLTQTLPQKAFYCGPMFRYERPQKGRYRQFHQIGIEVLGAAEPLADAEVIAVGWQIIQALGIADGVVLEINTLGDAQSRDAYRAALVEYFSRHEAALSADSRMRLAKNPLRILDSKDEGDRRLVADAPVITPHLSAAARAHHDAVLAALAAFGVPLRENPRIVRGLDYYSLTAFEFVTDRLGAQGTVMGGGRYNGLVEEMGGPPTPSVGWAAGMERLAMLMEAAGQVPAGPSAVAVVPLDDAAETAALQALGALRMAGRAAVMEYRGNLRRRMERANRAGAQAVLFVAADGGLEWKDLASGEQRVVTLEQACAG